MGRGGWGTLGLLVAFAPIACSVEPVSTPPLGEGTGGTSETEYLAEDVAFCSDDSSCATLTVAAEIVPVTLYIMFDRSGSMTADNKWGKAVAALAEFFSNEDSAGLRVALDFFPEDDATCSTIEYATPTVSAGVLTSEAAPNDTHEQRLLEAIASAAPTGVGTPTYSALEGAYDWASDFAAHNLGEQAAIVLVTDGEPKGCNQSVSALEQLVSQAATMNISTFVIGLEGTNPDQVDSLAVAGNTGGAHLVGSDDFQGELELALEAVKTNPMACEVAIPTEDGDVDHQRVNVCFSDSEGAANWRGGDSAADCGQADWYYDDPGNPTTIILCPAACQRAQAGETATLDIVFGCPIQIN